MSKKKINFNGFLTNTNSSILRVRLKHGFNIEAKSLEEAVKFIMTVDNISSQEASQKFMVDFPCYNSQEDKVFFISNSFDVNIRDETRFTQTKGFSETQKFHVRFVDGYLRDTVRVMRLFKEGNIYMPLIYYFYFEDNIPKKNMRWMHGTRLSRISIFQLDDSEIGDLERFIEDVKLPFTKKPLQLAFESFELSYHMPTLAIPFLLLMMSMESLFNPGGQGELTFRISRNSAVLIGKDKTDSQSIWENMKKLYKKRSDMVHTGKSNHVTEDDLLILRDYVRRSIKEFYMIGKGKDDILEMLNSIGFGDKPWLPDG